MPEAPVIFEQSNADAEAAQVILAHVTGRSGWRVARTEYGSAGDSYLVSREGHRLALKFSIPPPGLERLSELGVAPRLISQGEYRGRPWMLQEYIAGDHPRPAWFADHLPALAAGLRRYHDDLPLRSLLLQDPHTVHAQDLVLARQEVRRARQAHNAISPAVANAPDAFDIYEEQMDALGPGPEVPVHPDPNRKNFIVTRDTFFLIDWDGICLSDPLNDAGVMLWWYVLAARWPEFLTAYGLEPNQRVLDRVYWWTARRSLQVALWLVERGRQEVGREFMIDFVAAAFQHANPHSQP
jgi:aminoglycoside phosphotransferase (APT) family kinase protein